MECDVHHRTETFWQKKACVKKTVVILRHPVDRFVSAFNYARFGTHDDVKGVGGHARVLFEPFSNVTAFVESLILNEKEAWNALRQREGGRQFAKAITFVNGNSSKRHIVCYSNDMVTEMRTATACDFVARRYWQTSVNTRIIDPRHIRFISDMYSEDLRLFHRHCNRS